MIYIILDKNEFLCIRRVKINQNQGFHIQKFMLNKNLASFVIITLSSAFIFYVLQIIASLLTILISNGSSNKYYLLDKGMFGCGLFVGAIHVLVFAFLNWRNKSESLPHIIATTFTVVELLLVFGFLQAFIILTRSYYERNLDMFVLFIDYYKFLFLKPFLSILFFSIFAGIINKKLLMRIKSRYAMS